MQGSKLILSKDRKIYSFKNGEDGCRYSFLIKVKHAQKGIPAAIYIVLILGLIFSYLFPFFSAQAQEAVPLIQNKGMLLIEKEMIRLSDYKQTWGKKEKDTYKALLFLEDYFLNRGVTSWSMRVLHKVVTMRENTSDLKKKAFLDCEAWRVLDHDLKNYENKSLVEDLIIKRKYTKKDHQRYRDFSSDKVVSCIGFIHHHWKWVGQDYKDVLYDVKAKNALHSVRTYLRVKEAVH